MIRFVETSVDRSSVKPVVPASDLVSVAPASLQDKPKPQRAGKARRGRQAA